MTPINPDEWLRKLTWKMREWAVRVYWWWFGIKPDIFQRYKWITGYKKKKWTPLNKWYKAEGGWYYDEYCRMKPYK